MSAPKPNLVRQELRVLVEIIPVVNREYHWIHGMAYARAVNGGESVSTSAVSRPTEGLGALTACSCEPRGPHRCSQGRARGELETAARLMREAVNAMNGARAALARATGGGPARVTGDWSSPPICDSAEIAAARAAQRRRGETFGEA